MTASSVADWPFPWGEAIETATATVYFAGSFAVKLKKPLDFGYVDFRTRAARRRACEEEVALNRRLAPDVYLGVLDVSREGEVVDHLVLMRRLPAARRLTALLQDGTPVDVVGEKLAAIAQAMAAFHAGLAPEPVDGPGSHGEMRRLWDEGLSALDEIDDSGAIPVHVTERVRRLAQAYLDGRRHLFDLRAQDGWIRNGHGDLLADDIFVLDDGPRILDCLEFDDRFRIGDIWMDVAFLAMDLERLGHPELARRFLASYAAASGGSAPASMLDFFIAYRGLVRAKVAAIRCAQGDDNARLEAARLADLCLQHLRQATVTVTMIGGLPGTGKTTLARELSARTGAVHISSDAVRKEAVGIAPSAHRTDAWARGIYDPAVTAQTYQEMLCRAARALERGDSVVLDASWRDAALRLPARHLAAAATAAMAEVRCEVPSATALRRIHDRGTATTSDADEEVYRRMAAAFDRWPEASIVRTDRSDAAAKALKVTMRAVHRMERGFGT